MFECSVVSKYLLKIGKTILHYICRYVLHRYYTFIFYSETMAQAFETQRALLEYLNKNVNDRSLIQRMIKRWEVYKEWEMYYLVWEWEKVEEKSEPKVKAEIDDKELKELKRMNEKLMAAYKKLVKEKEVYMWMYYHLVFFYEKFKEWKKFVDWKVFWQTQYDLNRWIQQKEELVRDGMYERYKFEFWEVEQEECDAVEKIIAQRNEELAELPF